MHTIWNVMRSGGWIAPLFTALGSQSKGFATRLTFVGLVSISLIALGALVACKTEDDNKPQVDPPVVGAATVSVEATGTMATEQGSDGEFTITLEGDTTTAAVTVPITLAITGDDAAHTDYALTATSPASLTGTDGSRSVTIPTGESSAILTLSAGNDDDTTDETLTLTLGEGISGGGITVSRTTTTADQSASVTIVDDRVDERVPGRPENVEATSSDQAVTLEWTNPSDADFSHVVIEWSSDVEGANRGTPASPHSVSGDSSARLMRTIEDLTNGVLYLFRIRAATQNGNHSDAVERSVTPEDTELDWYRK